MSTNNGGRRFPHRVNATVPSPIFYGVRFSAACDLAFIDPTNQAAAPILSTGLDDSNSLTRQSAAEALGRMGPTAAATVAALRRLLEDPVPAVRRVTQNALEQIQGDPPSRVD